MKTKTEETNFDLGYDPTKKSQETEKKIIFAAPEDGILNVRITKNNTHLVVTDLSAGEIIFKVTGGMQTKNDRDKASAKIAIILLEKTLNFLASKKLSNIRIHFSTKGDKKNKTYRRMKNYRTIYSYLFAVNPTPLVTNFNFTKKINKTPIPHGQLRQKGGRRGRRV